MRGHGKPVQTVILAISLFLLSGIGIAYNIYTADEGEISVSVSRFIEYWQYPKEENSNSSAISYYTKVNILANDSIAVITENSGPSREYELLPPIIIPSAK